MLGLTLREFITFLNQLGLAVAGAAALWGFVFLSKEKLSHNRDAVCLRTIGNKLVNPLLAGFVIFVLAWILALLFVAPIVQSHEGIVIDQTSTWIASATALKIPFSIVFAMVTVFGFALSQYKPRLFIQWQKSFFLIQFLLISVLISLPVWVGSFDKIQAFFIGHNWHSILTIGTVIVIDYLFHVSNKSEDIRRALFPNFDMMSKAIWLGLGVEFASVLLIFPEALNFSDKFYFQQFVIAVLIINGAILSGPITRRLVALVRDDVTVGKLRGRFRKATIVSGIISISSWLVITFVDSFKDLSLSFDALILSYLGLMIVATFFYIFLERISTHNIQS